MNPKTHRKLQHFSLIEHLAFIAQYCRKKLLKAEFLYNFCGLPAYRSGSFVRICTEQYGAKHRTKRLLGYNIMLAEQALHAPEPRFIQSAFTLIGLPVGRADHL